ncbi:putative uncharacterized conserved protein [Azorhizobium caulinodans ORS 571]|uniref:UPF0434 protein AZC_4232 n=2 Tax=Xanthobacteraceae TaxID=335928 RepID=A8HSY3_AZOC5|nr:putative uncharacterized conserved protein [Azorhizobium caulinodans ORS 571]
MRKVKDAAAPAKSPWRPWPGWIWCARDAPAPRQTRTRVMTQAQRPGQDVDPKLLEILVCPVTKGPLDYDRARQELISRSARLAYPIRDGIPIMLADEARRLDESEIKG